MLERLTSRTVTRIFMLGRSIHDESFGAQALCSDIISQFLLALLRFSELHHRTGLSQHSAQHWCWEMELNLHGCIILAVIACSHNTLGLLNSLV